MAARLAALCNDDIGPLVQHLAGLPHALDLADGERVRLLDARNERRRIAERQHHGGWRVTKCLVERRRAPRHGPGDEPAANPLIARRGKFAVEPLGVGITAANEAEAARRADRARERAARNKSHRRQQDRMPDAEPLGQSRAQGHLRLPDQYDLPATYWH